jgi:transposase
MTLAEGRRRAVTVRRRNDPAFLPLTRGFTELRTEPIPEDRATAYTKAVKDAAPNALDVADRWCLLQNLSAAVEKTCHQHRDCLRKRGSEETVTEVPEPPPMLFPPAELPRTQIIEETLTESQDERLLQVRLACPDITRACDLAFADMVRHQLGRLLLEWIRQAERDAPKSMKGFAGFLRQDLDAVTVGLALPWSSGVVGGT